MAKSNWKATSGWSSVTDPTGVLDGKVLIANAGVNSTIEDYLNQIPGTSTSFSENHYSVIINYAFSKSNTIHSMSNGKFGLIARAGNFQDGNVLAQDCYFAVADLENGIISINRRNGGTETELIAADIPNDCITKGVKHVMEFKVYGTTSVTLQIYIDNTLFISFGDTSSDLLSSGLGGITVTSGTVFIDNFTIVKYTSTGDSATLWQPNNASSATLAAWYKADTGTTTISGLEVTNWNDQSGNGNNLSVPGGGFTNPTLIEKLIVNKDIISFDASTEKFTAPDHSSLDITSGISIFTVIAPITQSSASERIIVSKGTNYKFAIATDDNTEYTTSGTDDSTSTISANVFQILSVISSDAFYFDGSTGGSTTQPNGAGNTNDLEIQLKDAYVAEIIIYNGTISSTERQLIEGYLAHRWSTSGRLATTHPYKKYAPVT